MTYSRYTLARRYCTLRLEQGSKPRDACVLSADFVDGNRFCITFRFCDQPLQPMRNGLKKQSDPQIVTRQVTAFGASRPTPLFFKLLCPPPLFRCCQSFARGVDASEPEQELARRQRLFPHRCIPHLVLGCLRRLAAAPGRRLLRLADDTKLWLTWFCRSSWPAMPSG